MGRGAGAKRRGHDGSQTEGERRYEMLAESRDLMRRIDAKLQDVVDGPPSLKGAEVYGQHLAGAATDHVMELSYEDKKRIFNLGYFTWVEQQGVSVEDFVARRDQSYWTGLRSLLSDWDAMIEEFNAETGGVQEL